MAKQKYVKNVIDYLCVDIKLWNKENVENWR